MNSVLVTTRGETDKIDVKKLHLQFAHCSANALERLLRNAGHEVCRNYIEKVVSDCEICRTTAKRPPKPNMGLPNSTRFNECVAMDLHEIEKGLWYLHIICTFAKFSVAVSVRSKKLKLLLICF